MRVIVLAAGFSTRMGQLKQIMPIAGVPMVRQVVESFLMAGLEAVVVLGHQHALVQRALRGLTCTYVMNPRPDQGMFASVQAGCRLIEGGTACLVNPCDCPGILPATIQQICVALLAYPDRVVIPIFQGRRGHPVGLPADIITQICDLPSDTPGMNSLWRKTPERILLIEVADPAVLQDFDTPEDLPGAQ